MAGKCWSGSLLLLLSSTSASFMRFDFDQMLCLILQCKIQNINITLVSPVMYLHIRSQCLLLILWKHPHPTVVDQTIWFPPEVDLVSNIVITMSLIPLLSVSTSSWSLPITMQYCWQWQIDELLHQCVLGLVCDDFRFTLGLSGCRKTLNAYSGHGTVCYISGHAPQ